MNSTNAVIVYASSGSTNAFTFGPADRGRVKRVDLALSPPPTFAQRLVSYGLSADSVPNSDPTNSLREEAKTGSEFFCFQGSSSLFASIYGFHCAVGRPPNVGPQPVVPGT